MNVVWGYRFYPKILFISIMLVTIVTACIMIYEQGSAVGIPASVVVGIPSGYGLERDTDGGTIIGYLHAYSECIPEYRYGQF